MTSRRPWLLLLVASLLVGAPALAATQLLVPDPGPGSPPADFVGEDAPAYSRGAHAQMLKAYEEQLEAAKARETKLAAPEFVAERARSKHAYAGLGSDAAFTLARERFGKLVDAANPDAKTFSKGGPATFLNDFTMRLDKPGTDHGELVASPVPLRATNDAGKRAPVDLGLKRRGERFIPENAVSTLSLPTAIEAGVRVGSMGVFPAAPAAGDQAARRFGDDGLFYAGTDRATDTVLVPTSVGVESFVVLRAAEARQTQHIRFDLPAGARLQRSGSGGVDVVQRGRVLARILPPSAVDAQGQTVPTEYRVVRDALDVVVSHHSGSWAYPILVDPIVQNWTGGNSWYSGATAGLSQWSFATNAPTNPSTTPFAPLKDCYAPVSCYGSGKGLYIYAYPNRSLAAGWYGQWVYDPPGQTTKVPSVQLGPTYTRGRGNATDNPKNTNLSPYPYVGIWSTASNDWRAITALFADQTGTTQSLTPAAPNNGKNQVALGYVAIGNVTPGQNPAYKDAFVGGATISLDDPESPRFTPTSLPSTLPATTWIGSPRKDEQFTISPTAIDAATGSSLTGLGIRTFGFSGVTDTGGGTTGTGSQSRTLPCTGLGDSPCPGTKSLSGVEAFAFSIDDVDPNAAGHQKLAEGKRNLTVSAADVTGKATPATSVPIWVDRAGPALTPSGTLTTMDGQLLTAPSYTLAASSTDGSAATPEASRSGVKSLQITMDGTVVADSSAPCPAGNCPRSIPAPGWTLTTANYVPGWHEVVLVAGDEAGNKTTRTYNVLVGAAGSMVSPENGASTAQRFTLQAQKDAGSAATQAKFQYRRDLFSAWVDVPLSALTDEQGNALPNVLVPVDGNRNTQRVVWNVAETFLQLPIGQQEGPLQIRSVFSTASGPAGATKALDAKLDRRGLAANDATADVGPGSVDLLTGNFGYSAKDVSIATAVQAMTVSRTFNSRDPNSGPDGPFGPGWTSSTPVEGNDSDYSALKEASDGSGDLDLVIADGSTIYFEWDGSTYTPELGAEDLTLTVSGANRVLTDADHFVTTFTKPPGSASVYKPTLSQQPASNTKVTMSYEAYGDEGRVKSMVAPLPMKRTFDSTCTTSYGAGCRVLTFNYAATKTATGTGPAEWGDYPGRLKSISFQGYEAGSSDPTDDPASFTETVALYQYDSQGRLRAAWDPRSPVDSGSPTLKETYDYDTAGRLATIDPADGPAWNVAYQALQGDGDGGRLRSVARTGESGLAVTSVGYGVPIAGLGAPNQMAGSDVAAWGQGDVPTDATAIFPPDQVPGQPPVSYSRATIHYLDHDGQVVNTASPGSRISVSEHDDKLNVNHELTPANRARALGLLGAAKQVVWTEKHYTDPQGLDLGDEYGPMHETKLEDGSVVQARRHIHRVFSDHLEQSEEATAQLAQGGPERDSRLTTSSYDSNRNPTLVVVDPNGLNLRTSTTYDSATSLIEKRRMPRNPAGSDASELTYHYYNDFDAVSGCANRPEWSGLVCKIVPTAQPATPAPRIPDVKLIYNRLFQVSRRLEGELTDPYDTALSWGRETVTLFDSAGRERTHTITGIGPAAEVGTAIPAVRTDYDPATGRLVGVTTPSDGKFVRSGFDSLGRETSYTDAEGNTTTTSYDLLDRAVTTDDQKGTQTRTYDATTGDLTNLVDSDAGTFTAQYDADGTPTIEGYPGGLTATTTFDETGSPTDLVYAKGLSTWYEDHVVESIHGQWLSEQSTGYDREYAFDDANRLTQVRDRPGGGDCTTREYTYDADSNRLTRVERGPGAGGACQVTGSGTIQSNSYDVADRQQNGITYDRLERQTSIPASHAGGGVLTTSYYVNDMVRSQGQDGVSKEWVLDPSRRQGGTIPAQGTREVLHYGDSSDSPVWSATLGAGGAEIEWSRSVEGIGGELAALRTHDASGDATELQLANLHDDIVATAPTDPSATGPTQRFGNDEFGVPQGSTHAQRYGWKGDKQRRTELASGVVQMGVRSYVPGLGRFTSVDPVEGGSANDYDYAYQNPVTGMDLDGRKGCIGHCALMKSCVRKHKGRHGGEFCRHRLFDHKQSPLQKFFAKRVMGCIKGGLGGMTLEPSVGYLYDIGWNAYKRKPMWYLKEAMRRAKNLPLEARKRGGWIGCVVGGILG